ncbi:amino acid deaminase [Phyllobacterium myrsinacearum]|uniref:D-serine dehydratase n=1 Tax=Phyllobacterium myrsinacearum TaxID=28101 RepID=A0A839EQ84_9HYPH|nr:amino acid deaminase [Phyllobacterium myrsinacearum]MBA8880972.1 D-serine dehydratase [Phyllobacterium myrsinacearum]
MPFNTDALASLVLDDTIKSFPFGQRMALAEVGHKHWNVLNGDIPLPAAIIRSDALGHNSRWMKRFVAERGALIAPHVKTTMCPQIIARQIADGAWGLTVATVHQMRVCRSFGAERIILANQAVGAAELDAIIAMVKSPELDFMMIVDSAEGIAAVAEAARRNHLQRPVQLLLERGYTGGRTGCRTNELATALAIQIRSTSEVRLIGIEAFEGLIKAETGTQEEAVAAFVTEIGVLAQSFQHQNLFETDNPIISAGGSSYYDIVLEYLSKTGLRVVTRSGCYVTHDSGIYHAHHDRLKSATGEQDGLRRALEIWTYVQSIPEPGLALLTAGRRDCGTDAGLPVPLLMAASGGNRPHDLPPECTIVDINDQHSFMRFDPSLNLAYGDRIGLGISHPCTTFDKWEIIYLVDEDYNVQDVFKTFF